MELNRDFQEFLQSFVTHDVRFLIVGGYALAAHGHPRYTKDLDVWVWADPSNSPRIIDALEAFGFGDLDLLDILTYATGLEFPDAYERRMLVELGGIEVPSVSLEDLRVNKRAAGRLRDLADLEDLPPVD